MKQLEWGRDKQLVFADEKEYYNSLGLLCHNEWFHIVYEKNKSTNSWEDAYRIQCKSCPVSLPAAFQKTLKSQSRINNNEYVGNLYTNHKFHYIDSKHIVGDYTEVLSTVPDEYKSDFNDGYNRQ